MTPDQVYFRLAALSTFRQRGTEKKPAREVAAKANKQGLIKGKDAEGKPIQARIMGESLASRLLRQKKEREKAAALEAEQKRARKQRKRR